MRTLTLSLTLLLVAAFAAVAQTAPNPQYVITVKRGSTPLGSMTIELFPDVAPKHVRNFDSLVGVHFYDGTAFHRVIPGFMIQGGGFYSKEEGTPKSYWGISDDSQTRVPAEFSDLNHLRGTISMARLGNDINSGTSQFFICVADAPHLDGKYSIFGRVLEGIDVADNIVMSPRDASDNPNEKVEMTIAPKVSASVGKEETLAGELALSVQPTISRGELTLQYKSALAGHVSLALFDATGRNVATLVDEMREAGSHLLRFDATGYPSGAYMMRLRVGDKIATSRFVIAR